MAKQGDRQLWQLWLISEVADLCIASEKIILECINREVPGCGGGRTGGFEALVLCGGCADWAGGCAMVVMRDIETDIHMHMMSVRLKVRHATGGAVMEDPSMRRVMINYTFATCI